MITKLKFHTASPRLFVITDLQFEYNTVSLKLATKCYRKKIPFSSLCCSPVDSSNVSSIDSFIFISTSLIQHFAFDTKLRNCFVCKNCENRYDDRQGQRVIGEISYIKIGKIRILHVLNS